MSRKKKTQTSPPVDMLAAYRPLLTDEQFAAIQLELQQPLLPAMRVNTLKVDPGTAIPAWTSQFGWSLKAVPYCNTGWWVTGSAVPISRTMAHQLGFYYIQDAASMLPVELFDFDLNNPPLILDLAASPGGKTTHLACKSADRGLVIANDSSAGRMTALSLVMQTWGAVNVALTRFPGESFGDGLPETFDRVLLDAPCSMQGLRSQESHPMRAITEKEQQSLAVRQQRLLESALKAVKVGGQVVYSTCTLAPDEDEGVLDALLGGHQGTFQVDDVSSWLPSPAPAMARAMEKEFDPAVVKAVRMWPHLFGTSGFFAARLTKTGPLPATPQPLPSRPWEHSGYQALGGRLMQTLAGEMMDVYGFDLGGVLESQGLTLWQRGEVIQAIPERFFVLFSSLPVMGLGLRLGEFTPDGFAPSHEWVTRFSRLFLRGRHEISAEQLKAWMRGEDIPTSGFPAAYHRRVLVVFDASGNLVGRGRALADRLKNLLPHRVVVG